MKMNLKNLMILVLPLALSLSAWSQVDFQVPDCSDNLQHLYGELDAGQVVIICWVMPCNACLPPTLTAYSIYQEYKLAHPGKIKFLLVDDYGNTTCKYMETWSTNNGITDVVLFSNNTIRMSDYGDDGMPKIVIMAGPQHEIFLNVVNDLVPAQMTNALDQALASTGIAQPEPPDREWKVFPNPAFDRATLALHLDRPSDVRVDLFSPEGVFVRRLVAGPQPAGEINVPLDLSTTQPGAYLIKFTHDNCHQFRTLIVKPRNRVN